MKRLTIFSILLTAVSFKVQAQDSVYIHKDMGISIGIAQGIAFHSQGLFNKGKMSLCCQTYTQGMYLRRFINNNIALEASIVYGNIENKRNKSTVLSVPLTAQYYLSRKGKLHPYIGAGIIYNQQRIFPVLVSGTDKPKPIQKFKTANVQLSQGFSYTINTKIEINESIHIIPKTANSCGEIGMELGIGFKFH